MLMGLGRAIRSALRFIKKWSLGCQYLIDQLWLLEARLVGVKCGRNLRFRGRAVIGRPEGTAIVLGDQVQICSTRRSNPLSNFTSCTLRTLAPGARIELGPKVGISGTTICAARSIVIGEGTLIGSGALILDSDCHRYVPEEGWITDFEGPARPIVIGREVFIGSRAIILKGVTIGDRAIIGAGSVIRQDVPEGTIAVGNPPQFFPRKDLVPPPPPRA